MMATLAEDIEIAEARETLRMAGVYLQWLNKTGPYKRHWFDWLAPASPIFFPPIPISARAVKEAEETLRRRGGQNL